MEKAGLIILSLPRSLKTEYNLKILSREKKFLLLDPFLEWNKKRVLVFIIRWEVGQRLPLQKKSISNCSSMATQVFSACSKSDFKGQAFLLEENKLSSAELARFYSPACSDIICMVFEIVDIVVCSVVCILWLLADILRQGLR